MAHCKLRMHTRGSQWFQFWSYLPDSSRFTSARSPFRKHKCAPVDAQMLVCKVAKRVGSSRVRSLQPEVSEEGDRRFEVADGDADVLQLDAHALHATESRRGVQFRELPVPAQPDKELSRSCAASGPPAATARLPGEVRARTQQSSQRPQTCRSYWSSRQVAHFPRRRHPKLHGRQQR